ncbi:MULTISPECIES: sn-glycerol-3-phosphate ABC transporter ATP-binding protein UgpC [Rhodococcus]|uniref:Trehalose import ATP-binding protein SugC n=3 Tax=Rhodococcus TaxID=1827 RepID=K8XM60_RHOOP|nr:MULTISPECIES: sn-glycerol-3-phosphate ABC transporter ATP-binding protein UgpC [Rhodococcus]ANS31178.1 sn-glycerol-3-phosphate import ATP-binding protein UgpC [Rhodococcus opacus]EKT81916.1 sugar ABC transporter, ATP-binding protein [Rhodococcus opacus M213]MDI9948869.1 sn-glycerol-3-phosphate ABC transporter ATP-binding protein UgpC [Rhodococcus sp. IEGM 1305]MDI9978225.1 sn-glycerol-3-phosphate ABC transporter ATP-binding protein UgpC [Rhodococcus sp. IEGM 1307]MDV6284926.1 sn-glycerol-3-
MATVSYDSATRRYPGTDIAAVDQLDLEIQDGEFLVLVGPSGSGKTTALRMLAGLEDIDEGGISIGGREVTAVAPKDRDIAMVFQSYALYPHMSVGDNMGFALKLRGEDKTVVKQKVAEAARLLDLTPFLDRKPKALSGGQRQRVAMGRAIVRDPSVFLMDEPLSNLDAKLRVETRANIAALQQRLATTTVYVTHDQVEAMTMGHRVAVLKDGILQQAATPRELYERPANAFVAAFIGSPGMNLTTVPVSAVGVEFGELIVPVPRSAVSGLDDVTFGIRPEALQLVGPADDGFDLAVELVEELGADAYIYGTVLSTSGAHRVNVRVDGRTPPRLGQTVRVGLRNVAETHLFHPVTGARLLG